MILKLTKTWEMQRQENGRWVMIARSDDEQDMHRLRHQLYAKKRYGKYRIVGHYAKSWVDSETTIEPDLSEATSEASVIAPIRFREFL